MMDTEIVQMATNGGDSGDDGDDKPPREVPTSAETRNLLCLLRNKVGCSGGEDQLMRCVKQLEDAFLGPSDASEVKEGAMDDVSAPQASSNAEPEVLPPVDS
ncbi:hypothetical protein HPB50_002708 [Hyalomma asiaticum]|uniref:Uncharacterized protein n=1 Tax=Hyalomma asiaticum TaxID=266040 RepID=A0ACB7TBL8_HYAAI|nr:hypothetical protein HPB50_002708 [Hyalomma asiaticum]